MIVSGINKSPENGTSTTKRLYPMTMTALNDWREENLDLKGKNLSLLKTEKHLLTVIYNTFFLTANSATNKFIDKFSKFIYDTHPDKKEEDKK